jgi:hypothetical protein
MHLNTHGKAKRAEAKAKELEESRAHLKDVWSEEWQEVCVAKAAKAASRILNKTMQFVGRAARRANPRVDAPGARSEELVAAELLKATVARMEIAREVTVTVRPLSAPLERVTYVDMGDDFNLADLREEFSVTSDTIRTLLRAEQVRRVRESSNKAEAAKRGVNPRPEPPKRR